jgi:hypothetical protein
VKAKISGSAPDSAAWSDNAHGNAYKKSPASTKEQTLYRIRSDTDVTLKYGTAEDMNTRYTQAEMDAFAARSAAEGHGGGAHIEQMATGNTRTIHDAQTQLIKRHKYLNNGKRPPFNKSDW